MKHTRIYVLIALLFALVFAQGITINKMQQAIEEGHYCISKCVEMFEDMGV